MERFSSVSNLSRIMADLSRILSSFNELISPHHEGKHSNETRSQAGNEREGWYKINNTKRNLYTRYR
jgi:hypothetical protein